MIVVNSRFLTQKVTGTQRFAIEIAQRLKNFIPDIKFVAPKNVIHNNLAGELNVIKTGINGGHLWEQVDLKLYLHQIKGEKPLLINLVNSAPLFYDKQIVTIHDLAFLRNPSWFSKRFYMVYRFLIPRVAKKALKIVTVSHFSAREIVEIIGIDPSKIEVVYNGISSTFFFDPEVQKENYILTVSSLDPRKNIFNLIKAFKRLTPLGYKLVIVGSKNKIFSNPEINKIAKDIPGIEFTGYVSDSELLKLYQKARLFVFPSIYEGFGMPPLESMACGTPVVVSSMASLPEVCGDAAYYVNPFDPEDIARGIYNVLTDDSLYNSLKEKGLKHVKKYNWENSSRKFAKIIKEVY